MGGKKKFTHYGVRNGHENCRVYRNWAETEKNWKRVPNSLQKGFFSRDSAESWLREYICTAPSCSFHYRKRSLSDLRGDEAAEAHRTKRPRVDDQYIVASAEQSKLGDDCYPRLNRPGANHQSASYSAYQNEVKNGYHPDSNDHRVDQQYTSHAGELSEADSDSHLELNDSPRSLRLETSESPDVSTAIVELELKFDSEQEAAVKLVLSGANVFITGDAGCGKTTVTNILIKEFREQGKCVYVAAPTGRAAIAVGGTTTYVYAGWKGDDKKLPLDLLLKKATGKTIWARMKGTDVLLIDEISMVDGPLFNRLNEYMKVARNDGRPFGGVQLVVIGDFCQLPPVKAFQSCQQCGDKLEHYRNGVKFDDKWIKADEHRCPSSEHGPWYDSEKWAFRSQAWKECHFENVQLTTVHRQSDREFIAVLQRIRIGTPLSAQDVDLLHKHESNTEDSVKLFCTNHEADTINDDKLRRLSSPERVYESVDKFKPSCIFPKPKKMTLGEMLSGHRYDKRIALKKGMSVILTANINISEGLVNGAQGTITRFVGFNKVPKPRASRKGDDARDGSVLYGEHSKMRARQIQEFMDCPEHREWPVVQFVNKKEEVVIYADCPLTTLGNKEPYALLSRTQIPLIARWAITVHRSQGMTLDRVEVDLKSVFEPGQAYVGLSRARTLHGSKVSNLHRRVIEGYADPEVQAFLSETFGSSMVEALVQGGFEDVTLSLAEHDPL